MIMPAAATYIGIAPADLKTQLAAGKSLADIAVANGKTRDGLVAALTAAESKGPAAPNEILVRIALAYCDFAARNLELWRALFEHRMERGKRTPQWATEEQMNLFRHIHRPLAQLFPKWTADELSIKARSMFSAVHGMVSLGLEQKMIAVPIAVLRQEIAAIVRAMIKGLN